MFDSLGVIDQKFYQPNALHQAVEIDSVLGANGNNRAYNRNGNLTQNEKGELYEFDYANRLVKVSTKDSNNLPIEVVFTYDCTGRKIQKKVTQTNTNSVVTDEHYYYSGEEVIAEYNASDVLLRSYVLGERLDIPVAITENNNDFYFVYDTHGSVIAIANASGAVVEKYKYDAHGNFEILLDSAFVSNRYFYTARDWEAEIKLYHNRARFYDPMNGFFIQRDPMGYVDSSNPYLYSSGNSVNYSDPLGLKDIYFGEVGVGSIINPEDKFVGFEEIPKRGKWFGGKYILLGSGTKAKTAEENKQASESIAIHNKAIEDKTIIKAVVDNWNSYPPMTAISKTAGAMEGATQDLVRSALIFGSATSGQTDITLGLVEQGSDTYNNVVNKTNMENKGAVDNVVASAPFMMFGELIPKGVKPKVANEGGISLNSSDKINGIEKASSELIEKVKSKGRTIDIAKEGTEEMRYLNAMRAEANVGGENMSHILLKENPSKAAILEEFLHGTQHALGIIKKIGSKEAERHVKSFMIRHKKLLGISDADAENLRILMEAGL